MTMRKVGLLSISISILTLFGCNSGGNNNGSSPDLNVPRSTDMALHGPGGTASFAGDVKPILSFRGCFAHHMTPTWNPVEALTDNGAIVTFLTGTKSEECTAGGLKYVKAGDSANSFLYQKVSNNFAASCGSTAGAQMPLDGPYLFDYELATIKAWIDAGAMNN
jgi:hypothetical protein